MKIETFDPNVTAKLFFGIGKSRLVIEYPATDEYIPFVRESFAKLLRRKPRNLPRTINRATERPVAA